VILEINCKAMEMTIHLKQTASGFMAWTNTFMVSAATLPELFVELQGSIQVEEHFKATYNAEPTNQYQECRQAFVSIDLDYIQKTMGASVKAHPRLAVAVEDALREALKNPDPDAKAVMLHQAWPYVLGFALLAAVLLSLSLLLRHLG
jgi:hypothetical protein